MSTPAEILKHYGIALTGSVATGKSTVALLLKSMGYIVFDADDFARVIVKPGSAHLQKLTQTFGHDILARNGELDRTKLRDIVLRDANAKVRLEDLTHPAIHDMLLREIVSSGLVDRPKIFFYEAALIHEKGRGHLFLETWCTFCTPELQAERLIKRKEPAISAEDASRLIALQMPADQKARLSTRSIDTNGTMEQVKQQITALLSSL